MLVSALSPSQVGLHEYGRFFYDACQKFPNHEFIFASDLNPNINQSVPEKSNVRVFRAWRYNSPANIFKLIKLARREKPDIVWFNLIVTSFGDRPIAAFLGLLTPITLRAIGYKTCVTLHHLSDFIEFNDSRFKKSKHIFKIFAAAAEQALAFSGPVTLLLDKYVHHFQSKYWRANAVRMHHGFPEFQESVQPNNCKHILVFGKFGSYKKIEFPIEIFAALRETDPSWTMTIAGSSHPSYPGYYESFAKSKTLVPGLEFLSYVPNAELPKLFARSGIVLLPYSSATGVSGVAHLSAVFGVPVVAANIDDFQAMQGEEGIGLKLFNQGNLSDAVRVIRDLAQNDANWQELSTKSLETAQKNSIQNTLGSYIQLFESIRR